MKLFLALLCLACSWPAAAVPVTLIDLDGPVTPASGDFLSRALSTARTQNAALLVLRIDTPGGLEATTREMVRDILASPVPVAVYVAPGGARAASAGTYLLYASHVAAMAPGTNLGAATPVNIAPGGQPEEQPAPRSGPPSSAESLRSKVVHDAAAYLRSLAQLRGRNADWAERAVVEADSLSASEALKARVIDLIAVDLPDLLRQANGRQVEAGGQKMVLKLVDPEPFVIERNWKERLLGSIAHPNIALILVMIGIYGLILEFYNPGVALPGVSGAICLLLGGYALQLLPLTATGLLLLALGIAFMVAEAFVPTFGALGIGGVLAFIAGALMLVDPEQAPGLAVTWQFAVPLAAVSAAALAITVSLALRARHRPGVAAIATMLGSPATALGDFTGEGWVIAQGERWQAHCASPVRQGDRLRIVGIDGLMLTVEPDTQGDS